MRRFSTFLEQHAAALVAARSPTMAKVVRRSAELHLRAHRDRRRSVRARLVAAAGFRPLGGAQARATDRSPAAARRGGGASASRWTAPTRTWPGFLPEADWRRIIRSASRRSAPVYAPELAEHLATPDHPDSVLRRSGGVSRASGRPADHHAAPGHRPPVRRARGRHRNVMIRSIEILSRWKPSAWRPRRRQRPDHEDATSRLSTQRPQLVDEYFIENRNRLLEIAAFLDRLDRADPAWRSRISGCGCSATRWTRCGTPGDRLTRIQMLLSDPTTEPLERARSEGRHGRVRSRAAREARSMRYIDHHAHMVSRTTDDYAQMALTGCVAVTEPAFWAGWDRSAATASRTTSGS